MQTLKRRYETIGGLECRVIDLGARPNTAVILCHGYGAPGDDLVMIGDELIRLLPVGDHQLRFVFPAAILQPPEMAPYGGRAWWNINMAALMEASAAKSFDQLHDSVPPGLDRAADGLVRCVQEVLSGLHLAPGATPRYLLGGFSQGSMLTTHVALSGRVPPPDTLVQMSGTLICRSIWQASLEAGMLKGTDVVQSHGTADQILPFSSAETLRDLIRPFCKSHTFIPFHGPHTIPMQTITALAQQIAK